MRKIDWNAPMTKKEWAWLYGIVTGLAMLYGIASLVIWKISSIKASKVWESENKDEEDVSETE